MSRARRLSASLFATAVLAFAAAAPAGAQPVGNIGAGNLVNVQITANNILNNNDVDVTVPISAAVGIAANVCGVAVDVLAIDQPGETFSGTCTNVQRTGSSITLRNVST
jgi:hypothetical protein